MTQPFDVLLIFGFLTLFHLWGGAAVGAGWRGRRGLPIVWGGLIGGAPLYFGIERGIVLGSWGGLIWQVACLLTSALGVGLALPRWRRLFLRPGMSTLMVGTFIMIAGMLVGALLFQHGAEILSQVIGGMIFLFGAMWFGGGIRQLREPDAKT